MVSWLGEMIEHEKRKVDQLTGQLDESSRPFSAAQHNLAMHEGRLSAFSMIHAMITGRSS